MIQEICFFLLVIFHIFIWVFILLAFLNKKTAKINLYFIIPLVYILHILPIHILLYCKKTMYTDWGKNAMKIF